MVSLQLQYSLSFKKKQTAFPFYPIIARLFSMPVIPFSTVSVLILFLICLCFSVIYFIQFTSYLLISFSYFITALVSLHFIDFAGYAYLPSFGLQNICRADLIYSLPIEKSPTPEHMSKTLSGKRTTQQLPEAAVSVGANERNHQKLKRKIWD